MGALPAHSRYSYATTGSAPGQLKRFPDRLVIFRSTDVSQKRLAIEVRPMLKQSKCMQIDRIILNALGLFTSAIIAAVPVYVTYDVYQKGPSPEKQLELTRVPPINPMSDLSMLGDRVSFSIRLEKTAMNNLVIAQGWLKNAGKAPILPTDFHEPLSVNVDKPWKIVAVENKPFPGAVKLKWNRISETRFEADPTLLNPDDRVYALVYLTDTQYLRGEPPRNDENPPTVRWAARILNLKDFSEPPNPFEPRSGDFIGVAVRIEGWGLPFTIVSALLFEALYLVLLWRSTWLLPWRWTSMWMVIGASLLSFSAAEAIATYLFGSSLTDIIGLQPIDHWLNAPWIVLHSMLIALLFWQVRRTSAVSTPPPPSSGP